MTHVIYHSSHDSGVGGSNHALRGPPILVVGVVLIVEFCDHNIICFIKVVFQQFAKDLCKEST